MSVLAIARWKGAPERLLSAYDRQFEYSVAHEQPQRRSHNCAATDDGMVLVEVWESEEDLQAMLQSAEFKRARKEAGMPEPDAIETSPLHSARSSSDTLVLRQRREAIIAEHAEAELRRDIDAVVATFYRPRYEVNGEVLDGEDAVRGFLQSLLSFSSDLVPEPTRFWHADDAVIAEGRFSGTHDGEFQGIPPAFQRIPPTGRRFDFWVSAIFEFEEDRLVCEKTFLDWATFERQIGVLSEQELAT